MACEACKVSKIKCLPSEQPGVCRKCYEFKRECITRTGARIGRPRNKPQNDAQEAAQAPLPGPSSGTFSLNFAVPTQRPVDDSFETLRAHHAQVIDSVFPPETEQYQSSSANYSAAGASTSTGPATSVSSLQASSIHDFSAKPQFNISSAENLLSSFREMLIHFPCILLPADATVPKLAASKPFVLLAILSAASGSRTLHGHSLYDEEFRKVLGLKFMAGGERSVELLQGVLIYCAWYPFHLRPSKSQVLQFIQYMRVAAELVEDLELDPSNTRESVFANPGVRDQPLENIRVYLCYCYMVSSAMFSWRMPPGLSTRFTPWTTVCCDVLERNAEWNGDAILVPLIRLAACIHDAAVSIPGRNIQDPQQSRLIWLGLETQAQGIQNNLNSLIAETAPMKIAVFYTKIFLGGGTKWKFPGVTGPASHRPEFLQPSFSSLTACAENIGDYYDYMLSLDRTTYLQLCGIDWTRFVAVIILSIRLSFPMKECPEWDAPWARSRMRLSEFLDRVCHQHGHETGSDHPDVFSASCIIFAMVKERFDRRVSALLDAEQALRTGPRLGCPMIDGGLNQYISIWDEGLAGASSMPPQASGNPGMSTQEPAFSQMQNPTLASTAPPVSAASYQQVFQEPWTTITTQWANQPWDGGL